MDRLKEPSSWAGAAAVLGQVAVWVPGVAGWVIGGIGAACGGVAVYLREGGRA